MTTTPAAASRLRAADAARLARLLETDFGLRPASEARQTNAYLLDALDRGQHQRFVVWGAPEPAGLLYLSPSGSLVPAGLPAAGAGLMDAAERTGWRVLVGDWGIAQALLDAYPRRFRRRPSAREQRFMCTASDPGLAAPAGFRRAVVADLEQVTELACRLHVEDRMGPPITRGARAGVRARMADSIRRGLTYVVERRGRVAAKVDVSLYSVRRGGQIAGVYVERDERGQGIATGAVAAVARDLFAAGVPGVSLHVRSDNVPAIRAYEAAGLRDVGPWLLALR